MRRSSVRHLIGPSPRLLANSTFASSIPDSCRPKNGPPLDESVDQLPGSNSFAVAERLAGGAALIANDMHLKLRVPNIWFRTRMMYPDARGPGLMNDIIGVSLPGTPAITVGSNRKITWSFTNAYGDSIDWVRVLLHPADPLRYRSPTGWKAVTVYQRGFACARRTG